MWRPMGDRTSVTSTERVTARRLVFGERLAPHCQSGSCEKLMTLQDGHGTLRRRSRRRCPPLGAPRAARRALRGYTGPCHSHMSLTSGSDGCRRYTGCLPRTPARGHTRRVKRTLTSVRSASGENTGHCHVPPKPSSASCQDPQRRVTEAVSTRSPIQDPRPSV